MPGKCLKYSARSAGLVFLVRALEELAKALVTLQLDQLKVLREVVQSLEVACALLKVVPDRVVRPRQKSRPLARHIHRCSVVPLVLRVPHPHEIDDLGVSGFAFRIQVGGLQVPLLPVCDAPVRRKERRARVPAALSGFESLWVPFGHAALNVDIRILPARERIEFWHIHRRLPSEATPLASCIPGVGATEMVVGIDRSHRRVFPAHRRVSPWAQLMAGQRARRALNDGKRLVEAQPWIRLNPGVGSSRPCVVEVVGFPPAVKPIWPLTPKSAWTSNEPAAYAVLCAQSSQGFECRGPSCGWQTRPRRHPAPTIDRINRRRRQWKVRRLSHCEAPLDVEFCRLGAGSFEPCAQLRLLLALRIDPTALSCIAAGDARAHPCPTPGAGHLVAQSEACREVSRRAGRALLPAAQVALFSKSTLLREHASAAARPGHRFVKRVERCAVLKAGSLVACQLPAVV